MKPNDEAIGSALDQFRWDYEPAPPERRFFLKPVSAFFGTFKWDGHEGQFPVPGGRAEEPAFTDD